MELLFWFSLSCLAFPHIGYPLSMRLLAFRRSTRSGQEPGSRDGTLPSITIVVSAFNEENCIGEKLKNSLALSYPAQQLSIVVISDASTDQTDAIVSRYPGVTLFRQARTQGKTAGLNRFVPALRSDLLFFTDANSMCAADALLELVRPFDDAKVGYAVGAQYYHAVPRNAASESETTYWRQELRLKQWESDVSSVVGGDGAIMLLRRELFLTMDDREISDFYLPLQAVIAGYRGAFVPKAVCWELPTVSFRQQFVRKVRIVNRSLRTVVTCAPSVNPFRVGIFAYQLFGHKILRWLSPLFLAASIGSTFVLAGRGSVLHEVVGFAHVAIFSLASLMAAPQLRRFPVVHLPFYFLLVNLSALIGIAWLLTGRSLVSWKPDRSRSTAPPD